MKQKRFWLQIIRELYSMNIKKAINNAIAEVVFELTGEWIDPKVTTTKNPKFGDY